MSEKDRIHLLDTCVISELVKKRPEEKVADWIAAQPEEALYLSILTLGELNKGIAMLPDRDQRKHRLRDWIRRDLRERFRNRIIGVTEEVALKWGEIDGEAERKGRKIPAIDGLIAATAITVGAVVATRNEVHFKRSGVDVFNPWED